MLTPERIKELSEQHLDASHQFGRLWIEGEEEFARAIESEVRKDYESLIRQMLEALEAGLKEVIATGESEGVLFGPDKHVDTKLQAAITAARARLEKAP